MHEIQWYLGLKNQDSLTRSHKKSVPSLKLIWLAGKRTRNEDVFAIEHWDISSNRYVSFRECKIYFRDLVVAKLAERKPSSWAPTRVLRLPPKRRP